MKLSGKKRKRHQKIIRLRRKQTPICFFAFGELPPAHFLGHAAKKVQGPKTDLRKAAHLLYFVVRCADFSEKWCNCATFHHLFLTLVPTTNMIPKRTNQYR
ncbi:unnamed protein product, partial [Laminaria digitata]